MTKESLIQLLKSAGIKANKTYGQNFLLNEVFLEDMIEKAGVKKGDWVLEIGPGVSTLTERLLEHGAQVLAVEKDPTFLPILKRVKKDYPDTLRFEQADILKFHFVQNLRKLSGEESPCYKVVANIPYYITGKIIQVLLHAEVKPDSITILVQKEVAQNVVAKQGDLNILGLSVQMYADPEIAFLVPPHNFFPSPKVDSAVLHMKILKKPRVSVPDKPFFKLIKACFAGKRKQIHNTLANFLHIGKDGAEKFLTTAGIEPTVRPQDLSLLQWEKLYTVIFIENK